MTNAKQSDTLSTAMNTDAFEGSETVERLNETIFGDGPEGAVMIPPSEMALMRQQAELREILNGPPPPPGGYKVADAPDYAIENGEIRILDTAVNRDMRLKRCGLVFNEGQLTGQRWVAPPGGTYPGIVKVLPLYLAKPVPGLEITATDGEKYLLPKDFKGDWFDCVSPKKVRLIPE